MGRIRSTRRDREPEANGLKQSDGIVRATLGEHAASPSRQLEAFAEHADEVPSGQVARLSHFRDRGVAGQTFCEQRYVRERAKA
jgi:hypothetical protein